MTGIGVFGSTGRVGRLLVNEILGSSACSLSSIFVRHQLHYDVPSSVLVTKDMSSFLDSSTVIIDFSSKEATDILLKEALNNPKPLVIGTTGLSKDSLELMREVSNNTPVLYSSNMSLGVAVLNKIASIVSRELRDFDIEIFESHHKYKKDSPSGTALSLASSVAKSRNLDESNFVYQRVGLGERKKDDIGIQSIRGGDLAGKHTVGFYGCGEYIELTHNTTSRVIFAKGALNAALWIQDKENGLYSTQDMFDNI